MRIQIGLRLLQGTTFEFILFYLAHRSLARFTSNPLSLTSDFLRILSIGDQLIGPGLFRTVGVVLGLTNRS